MRKALTGVLLLVLVATMLALVVGEPATEPYRGYCRICKDARRIEFWHNAYFCDTCGWESSVKPMKFPGDVPADVNLEPPDRTPPEPIEPATPKKATPSKPKDEPYSLKGDKVGMRLSDFKRKYRRSIGKPPYVQHAPMCDDQQAGNARIVEIAPGMKGQKNKLALTMPWHAAADIVCCSKVFPFEYIQDESKTPTVAGVATDLLVYQFVDGFLYKIVVMFPHDGYAKVRRGLEAKWGPPTSKTSATAQNAMGATFSDRTTNWENDVSRIQLMERTTQLNTSFLVYLDIELNEVAIEREPDTDGDDL